MAFPSSSLRHASVLLVDPDKNYARKVHGLLFNHFSESLNLALAHSLHDGITHLYAHPVRLILMGPAFSDRRTSDAARALCLTAPNSGFLVYSFTPDESFRLDALRAGAHEVVFISDVSPDTFRMAIECTLARSWQATMDAIVPVAPKLIHDLNNAITAINGFADILPSRLPADAQNRVCVEQITKAGTRAPAVFHTITPQTSCSSTMQHEDDRYTTHTG